MDKLTFVVAPHNHGIQWLCKSTNFEVKGQGCMRPQVVGVCTVFTGVLAEHYARRQCLQANA